MSQIKVTNVDLITITNVWGAPIFENAKTRRAFDDIAPYMGARIPLNAYRNSFTMPLANSGPDVFILYRIPNAF